MNASRPIAIKVAPAAILARLWHHAILKPLSSADRWH